MDDEQRQAAYKVMFMLGDITAAVEEGRLDAEEVTAAFREFFAAQFGEEAVAVIEAEHAALAAEHDAGRLTDEEFARAGLQVGMDAYRRYQLPRFLRGE
jgi:hypothetical protein